MLSALAALLLGCSVDEYTGDLEPAASLEEAGLPHVFDVRDIDTQRWMSRVEDYRTIRDLVLPSTHDTGMYDPLDQCSAPGQNCVKKYVRTQRFDMYQQLRDGARFFDVRVDAERIRPGIYKLVTFHRSNDRDGGFGCDGARIDGLHNAKNVLPAVERFLSENPSEFVILRFHHLRKDRGVPGHLYNYWIDIQRRSFVYKNDTREIDLLDVPIGNLRGKVIATFVENQMNPGDIDPSRGFFKRFISQSDPSEAIPGFYRGRKAQLTVEKANFRKQ